MPSNKSSNKDLDQVNSLIWDVLKKLHGEMDISYSIDFVLVLFFYKYISDLYTKENESANNAIVIPEDSNFNTVYVRQDDGGVNELLNRALHNIEINNELWFQGILTGTDFRTISNANLRYLLNTLKNIDFTKILESNKISASKIFQFLIDLVSKSNRYRGGMISTPKNVAILLAKIMNPKSTDDIYDPACGVGTILIELARAGDTKPTYLYGQEINQKTYGICRMNMLVNNHQNANISLGDTLNEPQFINNNRLKLFDVVVSNPPFLTQWNNELGEQDIFNRFVYGIPSKRGGTYAFIEHMVASLKERGKMGVIVPEGILFNSGKDKNILRNIINTGILECVVALPTKLFSNASIGTAILVFNKGNSKRNTLFINAATSFEKGTYQNKLTTEDINNVVETYRNFQEKIGFSKIVSLEEIASNSHNLSPSAYVNKLPDGLIPKSAETKELGTLSEVFKGVHIPNEYRVTHSDWGYLLGRDLNHNGVQSPQTYITKEVAEKHINKLIIPGDILLFTHFDKPKIAIVPANYPDTIASNMITVIRPTKVHANYLYKFFTSNTGKEIILHNISKVTKGTTIKYVNLEDLIKLMIPIINTDLLNDSLLATSTVEKKKSYETELHTLLEKMLLDVGWKKENLFFEYRLGKYIYDLVIKCDSEIKYVFEIKSKDINIGHLKNQAEILARELDSNNVQFYLLTISGIKKYELTSNKLQSVVELPTPTK